MAMDDLLKEAIADAKQVRESALANARVALEEAFAPKLQSMLNATIQNEMDGGADELNPDATDSQEFGTEVAEEAQFGEPADEFNFESIVKELEEEAASAEQANAQIEEQPSEENAELEEANDSTEFKKADNKKPSAKASSSKTEDPQNSIKAKYPKAKTTGYINENEEDVNLDELIQELKNEYSETTDANAEINELQSQLNEHREVVKFLRSKLNEVNLLNAKLLFTNKLFKNHSMNESQKLRVIETLDRATTLKECKLVYSTLEEAYVGMRPATKNTSTKRITESMASKAIESTKPSAETVRTVINEGNDLAARFKKLAGITK